VQHRKLVRQVGKQRTFVVSGADAVANAIRQVDGPGERTEVESDDRSFYPRARV
jgi:hypothetical protein